ncbi:dctM-like transporters family protein, partial [Vibrio parahaemolyticus V-223/04]
ASCSLVCQSQFLWVFPVYFS